MAENPQPPAQPPLEAGRTDPQELPVTVALDERVRVATLVEEQIRRIWTAHASTHLSPC